VRKALRIIMSLVVASAMGLALWGCSKKEAPLEGLGKNADEAVKEGSKAAGEAVEKAEEAVEDAAK